MRCSSQAPLLTARLFLSFNPSCLSGPHHFKPVGVRSSQYSLQGVCNSRIVAQDGWLLACPVRKLGSVEGESESQATFEANQLICER